MIQKLRDKGLLDKKILIPAGVLLLLVGITIWALQDAGNYSELAEDEKKTQKDIAEREKQSRKEIKETVGKEIPTLEEVERYISVVPKEENLNEKIAEEYGEEVYIMYQKGELISEYDDGGDKEIKEGLLKSEYDDTAVKSMWNILTGNDTLYPISPYTSEKPGFGVVENYNVGYITSSYLAMAEGEYTDEKGDIYYNFTIPTYTLEEMTAEEFQEGFEKLGVSVNGVSAIPSADHIRELGVKEYDIEGEMIDLNNGNMAGVGSMESSANWAELDFKDANVYAGVVVPMSFHINMTEVSDTIKEKDGDITGEPKDLVVDVGGLEIPVKLVEGGEDILTVYR